MCLVMTRSGLEGTGELFDQLDRNFGEDHREGMHAMEAAVRLGWKQLPKEYRAQLPTLADAMQTNQDIHSPWSSALDEGKRC